MGVGVEGVSVAGVKDEMESYDDLAMGAPPGSRCDRSEYGQRG